ncbi:unnamed protein product, partial [marine sediment metagenome]
MALQTVRIGSADNIYQYDDADFDCGVETTAQIKAGLAPVDATDVLRLSDVPGLATMVTSAAVITNHAIVRGDGGARGIQDSLASITDAGDITIPDGQTIGSASVPAAITIEADGDLLLS